ncbi:hypothetical protein MSG28_014554 [Choristoneura fumiferana]|uniref:Uncharacterized protein n=1 Tax=Choristoneura fumiferana TaxID=7141 RepID=A0ACC0JRY9_CHOFU|nr:hypothetical protein MSG28_014554 [Choristoneura fumiferana]
MTLEEARAALLAEILGGGAEPANQASSSENLLDKSALQQIVNGCFVKLQHLRLLQCDVCKKSFHKRSRLMIHYFDTHVNKDLEESDIPPTGARVEVEKSAPDVKNFGRTNNNGLKLHPCNICDESFAFKIDMLIHQLKHSGKKPQECEICQKLFISKSQLNTHVKLSHIAETCDNGHAPPRTGSSYPTPQAQIAGKPQESSRARNAMYEYVGRTIARH